jgi:radical SAM superfamily enzyme YgiQ (UPF0313 family)
VTDHPQIGELLARLLKLGAQFSISSLRITSLTSALIGQMVEGGIRSIALAPEAGSECLRQVIKKGITEPQILEAIQQTAEKGIPQVKLYFMVGLPEETDEDIEAIVELTLAGKAIIDRKRSRTRLTLNISPFVPKAGTPFQRLPMAPLDVLQSRIGLLKNRLARKGIRLNNESPSWSEVQAVLSRGDSSLASVLADIEKESLPGWRQAVEKHRLDTGYFAHSEWEAGQPLPWDIIRSNPQREKLSRIASSQIRNKKF